MGGARSAHGEMSNVYMLVGKSEEERPLGRSRR
jgi:hypothetical protein